VLSTEMEGFARWIPWNKTKRTFWPKQPGGYVFRVAPLGTPIGRVNKTSDIIYVGSTPKGGTIRGRLGKHLLSHKDQKGVGWQIDKVSKAVGPLEVGWKIFSTADQAANYESEILWRYQEDHIELSPLNNQMPQRTARLSERMVRDALGELPVEGVVNLLSSLDGNKRREVRARLVTMGKLKA
jgi:hypothetical protein